jgi:hypothetical protein
VSAPATDDPGWLGWKKIISKAKDNSKLIPLSSKLARLLIAIWMQ